MIVKPTGSAVLCRVLEKKEETTPSGIVLPDTAHGRPNRAVVVEVGPGRVTGRGVRVEPAVTCGDRVVFDPYRVRQVLAEGAMANSAGTPLANHGQYFLIDEEDIFGIEEDDSSIPNQVEIDNALSLLGRALGNERHDSDAFMGLQAVRDLLSA